ncbi:C-terminal processing protease CtpA/Prc, contains a PDZ domain [Hyunsoonleella jejuensis]|uniref:Tricorn protease homolog n=1 Tax=Hyunsoonleella jejuensis TaxID=419940 RepID=A0A1H9GUB7_9FLAO|nr:S41 family peptidase [Hyunsoonleella jejuensis]SEQ53672.1 C-terminal processing protease CtpA/Prc, contains a PDZ domain [Hyunsoonleella jejuensis]
MKLNSTFLAFSIFACVSLGFSQNPLINYPAVSPDGQTIAFNYQGDIWTATINGQNPKRLTVHEAYDTKPVWSADGKSIAFISERFGNNDVFVMPAIGGAPKRLTYHSTSDIVTDYTSNGDIVFSTRRNFVQVEREYETHIVNEKGGTPKRYLDATGFDAALSPNGKFVVFVKGSCRLEREAYRGPANRDIWLYNIKNDSYTKLTDYDGNDFYPQWGDNNTIYFQSSRSGKYNVHKLNINDSGALKGEISQVTSFSDMGMFSFQISRNGKDIIAVKGNKVFLINAATANQKEININIASDYRFNPVVHKTYSSDVDDIAISPNGNYAAITIRGEIFIRETSKDKKRTVNLTRSSFRDTNATWLNDSTLLFVSDRDGQKDVYMVTSDNENESDLFKTLKHKIERITKTEADEDNLVMSPDGKAIAYNLGRGQLVVANIDNKGKLSNKKTLLDGWATANGVAWSPDSKWLAYSLSDLDFNSEIYIHKADNSQKPVNISMHPKQDRSPVWSPDGKKLMFSSNRNNSDYDVWFTWLTKADWEKTSQDWEEDTDDSKDKKEDKKEDKDKKDKTPKVKDVVIDFDDIHERQVQVTSFVGGEFGLLFSKDSKTIYYYTGNGSRGDAEVESDLFKVKWDGKDKKALTTNSTRPSNVTSDKKLSKIYLTKRGGSLSSINMSNDKMESLSFSAKLDIDYNVESQQIFNEAWKAINDGFYDPDFHGQDWDKLRRTYEPLALSASTRSDFQTIFNWMLGQINASHMGLYRVETREDLQPERTGLLGVELEPTSNGKLKVVSVVPGMPADRVASQIQLGDIIMSVNGNDLTASSNIYEFLQGTANEKIYLEITRGGTSKEIVIRPQYSNRSENYNAWVKERKRLTDKYSNGRLGYIHIQGMNWTSFERFERELTAAGLGKDGLVIDVRFNGGGWTTDYLMAVLNVKQHAYTVPRGAAKNLESEHTKFINHYPYSERLPLASWTKPSIALCNQNSYSNAEIFSHAYKTLDIGTLVGVPTFGAVISTGSAGLIDGSYVRMPFRGWYVKETKSNMELGPAVPDIIVYNNPDDKAKNSDTQLKKAVEELLSQLK